MKLRWYNYERYDWNWDSRNEEWYKYRCQKQGPTLQYYEDGKWKDVPTVNEIISPRKPKD